MNITDNAMPKNKDLAEKILSILIIKGLILLFIFLVPIFEPDFTIACVSEPCEVPKITLFEKIAGRF